MLQQKIAFIGYSGHAYVCIETAQEQGFDLLGYYELTESNKNPYNLPFLGIEEGFEKNPGVLFASIGDNEIREAVYNKLNKIEANRFTNLQHPTAVISKTVSIQDNVLISARAVINALSVIETGVIINTGAIVEHDCFVKAFAHIAPGAVLCGNVTVGKRSFIGAGAVVKQGITIGDNVVVGAGAVVISDIPSNCSVVGNPAKPLKKNK